jgi:hypothetical protein
MPSGGGLTGLLVQPTQYADRLPDPPPGHVEIPTGLPGHTLFVPPDATDAFIQLILAGMRQRAEQWRPTDGLRAYWNGDQRYGEPLRGLEYGLVAPSSSHYRVASTSEDVDEALAENEPPLWWQGSSEPDFHALKALQEAQWAAPNGAPIFTQDATGRYQRTDGGLSALMHLLGNGR